MQFYFHRQPHHQKNSLAVLLSSAELWDDCFVGIDDLEGIDGGDRQ